MAEKNGKEAQNGAKYRELKYRRLGRGLRVSLHEREFEGRTSRFVKIVRVRDGENGKPVYDTVTIWRAEELINLAESLNDLVSELQDLEMSSDWQVGKDVRQEAEGHA